MSACVVAQLEVHDPASFADYLEGFHPILARHGGRLLALSPEAEVIEGTWAMRRTAVMRFPTPEDVRRWHAGPDYRALAELRHRSARANIVLLEGLD